MSETLNGLYRKRWEEHVERIPETPEEERARVQVCNVASDLRKRLGGYVPLMGGMNGLSTSADDSRQTLTVYTSNRRHTHDAVMAAIWSVVPNCSAVHVEVRYCGKDKDSLVEKKHYSLEKH